MLFDLNGLDLTGLLLASAFGFIIGKLRKQQLKANSAAEQDVKRAREIVNEFEGIAQQLNQAMQQHQRSVGRFKERLESASSRRNNADWASFSAETERILGPTLALADQVARSYDQLKQQSSMLQNLQESRMDPLTGVGNRRMFNDSLESQMALYQRYGTTFSLVMLDIDYFKKINDTKGHLHGDHALTSLGSLLADIVRETDHVARYGGEEFTVLMPETPTEGAAEFAERLRAQIEQQMTLTVSIGVASTDDFGQTDTLVHAADRALYAAKEAGRNQVFLSTIDDIRPVKASTDENAQMDEAVTAAEAI